MLKTRQQYAFIIFSQLDDVDDGRDRLCQIIAEEFKADSAYVGRQTMQDEAGRGDEAVAAFFLYPRQAAEKFVGDIFAEAVVA